MKFIIFFTALFGTMSSYAFQDGTYTCGSRADFLEVIYKVKTLTIENTELPHFEITKKHYQKPNDPNSKDRIYKISGVATVYTDDAGQETLGLGNITVDLTQGRIICQKD